MRKEPLVVIALGIAACVALYVLVDIYASLIVAVIAIALAMSVFIMQDSLNKPNIVVFAEEGGRGIRVRNRGNARALSVQVSLAPQDLRFEIPELGEDKVVTFQVPALADKTKVDVQYRNEEGLSFAKTIVLLPGDVEDEDLLKPLFPLFGWK